MLDINFGPFPELLTDRLRLREVSLDDAPVLFRLRSDEQVMRYLGRPMHKDISESVAMIERMQKQYADNEGITWIITLKDDPTMIGTAGFWRMDKENHRAEIGYLLTPELWGKGLVSETINVIVNYAFEVLHFHSIEANTDPENTASGRVLEKCGFVAEAYFRENFYFDGQFLDSKIYSRVRG